MQKQFEEYLLAKNYSPLTSIDYPSRLERLCRKEKISYEHLAQNLSEFMPQYDRDGKKAGYGKRSHSSVINALRRFAEFLSEAHISFEGAN
jgi:site-specific recombinase XerD